MNKPIALFIALVCLLSFPPLCSAASLTGDGKIDSAVVYSNRAVVTRAVEVEFTAGANTLLVSSIPGSAEDNSIRVTAVSNPPVTILSVDVAAKELAKQADPKAKALADAIETEMEKVKALDSRREARAAQIEFLRILTKARAEDAKDDLTSRAPIAKPTPQELAGIMDMAFDKRLVAEKDIALIEQERKRIFEEIDRLKRDLAQTQGGDFLRTKTITATFMAETAGKGRFEVEYMLPGAWWSPAYVVRGDSEKGAVEITYGARIRQRTGEDWRNVKLTLSTAQPTLGAKAPKVDPWWVGVREPAYYPQQSGMMAPAPTRKDVARKAKAPAAAGAAMDMALAEQEAPPPAESKQEIASALSSGHIANFQIPSRADVLSGGEVKKVSVAQLAFQAQLSYVSSPALSQNVYVRATAPNISEFPLLAGEADVFARDTFVGKSAMDVVAPREKLEVDLGVDQSFKVERKLIKREAGAEGIISSKKTVRMVYQVEIQNLRKNAETVEVTDRLPISKDERLTVSDVVLDPKPEKKSEQNILTWKLEVKPQEKRKIRMEFTLSYPKDLNPDGF